MKESFKEELTIVLKHLNNSQKLTVLDYAKTLPKKKSAKNKKGILKFAGSISKNDLRLMEKSIKIGCENIDENEW